MSGEERLTMANTTSDTLTRVRNLVADWKRQSVAEFDSAAQAGCPLKVAEAARELRCVWDLERVLATAVSDAAPRSAVDMVDLHGTPERTHAIPPNDGIRHG